MAEERRGGARKGAGRKATGAKTRHYTVNLPIDEADLLEKHAAERNLKVNKYLRELIRIGAAYTIENLDNLYVTETSAKRKGKNVDLKEKQITEQSPYTIFEMPLAAEEEKPYVRDN